MRPPSGRFGRGLRMGASLLAWLAAAAAAAAPVLAAGPTASPVAGDVRTSPSAPGLVGDPLFAVAGVLVIGLVALGATLLYVRLTERS